MKLIPLKPRLDLKENKKLYDAHVQLAQFIEVLTKRELPKELVNHINTEIQDVNATTVSGKKLRSLIRKKQLKIVQYLEKELKLVTKNHYKNTWLALGMAAFGIPIGIIFGTSLGNMAFLGIGLPFGMLIGIVLGTRMDTKALEEGRQLNIELT